MGHFITHYEQIDDSVPPPSAPDSRSAHPTASRVNNPVGANRGDIPAVGTGVPLCDNYPGGPVCARGQDGRPHRRLPAGEELMAERRKPIVTELALADALDQLVNLIEELRADADLRVQITTDGTELVKLTFSGTPDVGFPRQREVRSIPAEIVRRVWNENLRDYEIV